MKIILLTTFLVTIVLGHFYADKHTKALLLSKSAEIDSLKRKINDFRRDSILVKMQEDMEYRTRVNTITKLLSDKQICKILNQRQWKKK